MCGINGIFAYHVAASAPQLRELHATRDHMAKRGPDGFGEWWSADRRLALGHRRLSIIDLSDRASQPMASADARYQISFNGEIYNYPALKRTLEAEGAQFRTTSDTEVLLHLYARYGAGMVDHLRGMFAFAIWDNAERSLFLARDPYGIKPLYYADDGWTFRFASQVKALLAGGHVSRDPEPAGIVGFHLWGSVPEPFTLYRDIQSLPAGHTLHVGKLGAGRPRRYASIAQALSAPAAANADMADGGARIRSALGQSVAAHLLADVEVGVFLSAGIDSGAILGLVRDAGQQRITAITLAFEEYRGMKEDEAPLAAEVAQLYGADHIIRTVGRAEFASDLPDILAAMDQPSMDGINSWFVSKATREAGLKVALSGVGGDELFSGYDSFSTIPNWVNWMAVPARVPGLGAGLRRLGKALQLGKEQPKKIGMAEYGGSYAGAYLLRRGLFLPFELRDILDSELVEQGLRRLSPLALINDAALTPMPPSPQARVAALEASCYMRNQLLCDSDWASMAHGVELRTPLVDFSLLKQLVPYLPQLGFAAGKLALANAPQVPLPVRITARAKTGFTVPNATWTGASDAHRGSVRMGISSRAWARNVYTQF